jgi:O-antigen/teichoic acid export membrane protein
VHGRIVRTHAVVVYPLLASLIALAPILIPWLLGSPWTPAVVPAQVLAIAGMAFVLMVGTGQAVLAAGHPRAVLVVNLCSFLGYGTTMFFVAPHGLVAVSAAAATFYVLMVVANYQFLLKRYMGIPVRRLVEHAGPAVVSSLALIGVELGVSELTTRLGAPRPGVLALSVVAGLVAYAGAVRLLFPAAWRDCRELVRGLAPGARGGRGRPTVVTEASDAVVAAAE